MAPNPIVTSWRSFWHTMTSYDRHASHDAPYRTGQHVPLNSNRHPTLTSVASGAESVQDLTTPFTDERSVSFGQLPNSSPIISQNPRAPYSPGMRSNSAQRRGSANQAGPGEIQLQNFQEGLPPPPPVSHSWKRIDRWAEENYEELFDNLSEGCTQNDLNDLEHQLDVSLPMEVRESLQIHDGQERGGLPTGIIFGCMLLDCEEIVQEWQNWKTVNQEFLMEGTYRHPQTPTKAFGGIASSSTAPPPSQPNNSLWRQELINRQDSQPSNAVQKAYAHPGWIPLARDWGGNNLAVDLAPGPLGKWGQVIIFGRDYDCKYVVARSWAAFLAMLADDLSSSEKVFIDEETNELKLREFKNTNVEPGYLDILRWRMDQKYGRKPPRRRASNMASGPSSATERPAESPYGSPSIHTDVDGRGRSPPRAGSGLTPLSPKAPFAKSSPLAKVAEERPAPVKVHSNTDVKSDTSVTPKAEATMSTEDLVEITSPIPNGDVKEQKELTTPPIHDDKENKKEKSVKGLGVEGVDGMSENRESIDALKTVEI